VPEIASLVHSVSLDFVILWFEQNRGFVCLMTEIGLRQ
jgi:hypothetical protein